MASDHYLVARNSGVFSRLMNALSIPGSAMKAALHMDAGDLVTLTITRPLTEAEIADAADVLEDADLEPIPTGTISYNFLCRSDASP